MADTTAFPVYNTILEACFKNIEEANGIISRYHHAHYIVQIYRSMPSQWRNERLAHIAERAEMVLAGSHDIFDLGLRHNNVMPPPQYPVPTSM